MKNIKISVFVVLLSLVFSGVGFAQEEAAAAEAGPTFSPIEIFACNYNKGQDRDDLDKVIAGWNKWMDESGSEPYSAWIYTAFYGSPEYSFDLAWLGVWPDGKAMGKGTDQWLGGGGEHAAAFDKVLTCDVHSNFASMQLRSGGSENSDNAVLGFSDCTFKKGSKFGDAVKVAKEWHAYMKEQGSTGSAWWFFPVYGGDPDWDFKAVSAYSNHAELGADYDRYGNGGGFMKAGEIIGDAYDCGVTRIYNSERIRDGIPQQE